jgi:branched-chain amino acid transport system ATP-binding protein
VLLMDEPSMGLAPVLVQQNFEIIQQIHEEGMACSWSSRTPTWPCRSPTAATSCRRAIVLADDAENLLANPQMREAYLGG